VRKLHPPGIGTEATESLLMTDLTKFGLVPFRLMTGPHIEREIGSDGLAGNAD